jgi:tetratricopeptide (TPR) repeat protein
LAINFKLVGFPIAIGLDFVAVMLLLGVAWRTPDELPEWIAVATVSVLAHELAHAGVFDWFGASPSIRLYGGGGVTVGTRLPARQTILVAAAGPAIGLVFGGIVWLMVLARPELIDQPMIQDLLWVNLGWSAINLMPYPGLDGGVVVDELVTLVLGRPAQTTSRIFGLLFVAVIFFGLIAAGMYEWAFPVGFVAVFTTLRMGLLSDLMGVRARISPEQLLMEGRYNEAFELARREAVEHPGDPSRILVASNALRLMTRHQESLAGYDRILAAEPYDPGALYGRIAALQGLGRTAEAEADLRRLLALPADKALVSQLAALYVCDRHEEGLHLAGQAAAATNSAAGRGTLENMICLFEYTTGREEAALQHASAAVSREPGRADLHELRALILCDLGRFDDARAAARRALAGAPQHPEFHQTLGLVERLAGEAEMALSHLLTAAVACPNGPRAVGELATCFAQLGRGEDAQKGLSSLPAHASSDPFVMYANAALAANAGDDARASQLLRSAAAVRPELAARARWDPAFLTVASLGRQAAMADPA